jgi:positive regulator of sigma E activity
LKVGKELKYGTQKLKEPLSITHPELAKQWHPTENGDLTPDDVSAGSRTKAWWRCPEGPDHEWPARISHRASAGSGCPFCRGLQASVTNSLASLYPGLARQWHPTKNGDLTPANVVAASGKKVWWLYLERPDHEWPAVVGDRTSSRRPTSCPYCANKKVSVTNSLATLFPNVAAEWHPTKNGDLTPDQVIAGSNKIFWWQCSKDPTHEWPAKVMNRTFHPQPTGCPYCSNAKVSDSNSLAALYPELAAQWHPTKNENLAPEQIVPGSNKRVWWECPEGPDHEWPEQVLKRTSRGYNCPFCASKRVSVTNSLATLFPDVAAQWHPTKNGDLTPGQVVAGSHEVYWWQCPDNPNHQWPASLDKRTGAGRSCPVCNQGWTIAAIRGFVDSLKDHIALLTPAELYKLFQQHGLLQARGKGRTFVKALATGRFPLEEIDKFAQGQPSLVDDFLGDPDQTLEAQEINGTDSL